MSLGRRLRPFRWDTDTTSYKTHPLDIQSPRFSSTTSTRTACKLAAKVAEEMIPNMQDRTGYFYYQRYSSRLTTVTPAILGALAGLYELL